MVHSQAWWPWKKQLASHAVHVFGYCVVGLVFGSMCFGRLLVLWPTGPGWGRFCVGLREGAVSEGDELFGANAPVFVKVEGELLVVVV